MKKNLTELLLVALVAYLIAVLICNIEHSKQLGIKGMDPCGSCWALQVK